jgi:signal transduction histidine kinase
VVAISVALGAAAARVEADPAGAKAMLDDLRAELHTAVQQLRELARGIYPPLLLEKGLAPALGAVARGSPLPVRVVADGLRRRDQASEAAAYFCCLEAVQNATKHAGDTTVTVRLWDDGGLHFEVKDEGRGFSRSDATTGTGFVNMADRLGALGGTLEIISAPGEGTTVSGWLPAPAPAEAPTATEGPATREAPGPHGGGDATGEAPGPHGGGGATGEAPGPHGGGDAAGAAQPAAQRSTSGPNSSLLT